MEVIILCEIPWLDGKDWWDHDTHAHNIKSYKFVGL